MSIDNVDYNGKFKYFNFVYSYTTSLQFFSHRTQSYSHFL